MAHYLLDDGSRMVTSSLPFTALAVPPSIPSSGNVILYAKDDGNFYQMDDTGTETILPGGSGSGGGGGGSSTGSIWNVLVGNTAVAASSSTTKSPFVYNDDRWISPCGAKVLGWRTIIYNNTLADGSLTLNLKQNGTTVLTSSFSYTDSDQTIVSDTTNFNITEGDILTMEIASTATSGTIDFDGMILVEWPTNVISGTLNRNASASITITKTVSVSINSFDETPSVSVTATPSISNHAQTHSSSVSITTTPTVTAS